MVQSDHEIEVYLEIGQKRTFASAAEWPGWCRSGRDEAAALQALLAYGPRYTKVLRATGIEFHPPADLAAFVVSERLTGTMTTDFGAPEIPAPAESRPLEAGELERLEALLAACWQAFDRSAAAAAGKELRKGPRGGGRELGAIAHHVQEGEQAYLSRIGGKLARINGEVADQQRDRGRGEVLEALRLAASGATPAQGPRGGKCWSPRYFVRRAAWHVLDHAWEIEDRIL